MKIEELYNELAKDLKPKGLTKENQEWAGGVVEALFDWNLTNFSDLCKAIGYSDGLEINTQTKLNNYLKDAQQGRLRADDTDKYAKEWLKWNEMIATSHRPSIVKAAWAESGTELSDEDCENIRNVFKEIIEGVGEQIENEKRKQKMKREVKI